MKKIFSPFIYYYSYTSFIYLKTSFVNTLSYPLIISNFVNKEIIEIISDQNKLPDFRYNTFSVIICNT